MPHQLLPGRGPIDQYFLPLGIGRRAEYGSAGNPQLVDDAIDYVLITRPSQMLDGFLLDKPGRIRNLSDSDLEKVLLLPFLQQTCPDAFAVINAEMDWRAVMADREVREEKGSKAEAATLRQVQLDLEAGGVNA